MNYVLREAILDALSPLERVRLTGDLARITGELPGLSGVAAVAAAQNVAQIVRKLTEEGDPVNSATVPDAPQPETADVWVSERKFDELKAKVEWYAKRAAKLGAVPMTMEEAGERYVQWGKRGNERATFPVKEELPKGWKPVGEIERQIRVKINGNTPKFSGWRFVAAVDHVGKQNIIRAIPGGGDIPDRYRSSSSYCEHCSSARVRNSTYLVAHTDGTVKQIGSSCLKDFLGHADAEKLAELAAWQSNFWSLVGADDAPSDHESEERDGPAPAGGREQMRYEKLSRYLPFVAASIRLFGWISRARSSGSYGQEISTADDAFSIRTNHRDERKNHQPTEADKSEADAAEAWAASLSDADVAGNDFLSNLRVLGESGVFHVMKHAGIAAAIVMSYQKAQEKLKEAERRAKRGESEFVGQVGKRQRFERLTLEAVNAFEGTYGVTHIHRFADEAGNIYVWKSSSGSLTKGKTYNFKATIKDHTVYVPREGGKSIKQTILTRVAEEEEVKDAE